jgi:endoglucanase
MKKIFLLLTLLFPLLFFQCCNDGADSGAELNINPDTLVFPGAGGNASLQISLKGSKWIVSSDQGWCTVSIGSSTVAYATVTVTAEPNLTGKTRNARLTFIADDQAVSYVGIGQTLFYPNYSVWKAPDATGMENDAMELAAKMYAGWNLGNSLEVPGNETGWGNPQTTQRLIDSVKAVGINTIRIPCAWDSYIADINTGKLSSTWLNRVKEVVDYCFNNGMYVILNIHWDGGWLEENPTYTKQNMVNAKQNALWQQIAMKFRDYDEHLLFAGTNEVHTPVQPTNENVIVQMSYNQTFVNAVRSTGGKNSYRNLLIQAYNTNIDMAVSKLVVSNDTIPDRLMVEVHYYDPWEFCGLEADADWGTVKNLWGTAFAAYGTISSWGQEDYMQAQFQKMKTSFVDEGYPVILGEYGATRRSALTGTTLQHHLDSRAYYIQYATTQAKNHGMVPIIWDNGFTGNLGMGIFNREDGSVFDHQILNAFLSGAAAGTYPF